MRVLWIVNQPIAHLCAMLDRPLGQSGGWMEAAYLSMKRLENVTLGVAAMYMGTELKYEKSDGCEFYAVPFPKPMIHYNSDSIYNIQQWEKVFSSFRPDLIHSWGTEYPASLCALKAAKGIPSVVYMQGVMSQIAEHCLDGVSLKEQIRNTTLFDIKNRSFLWNSKKQYGVTARREAEILKLSGNVIVESEWAADNCLIANPDCNVYWSKLPVNTAFFNYNWSYEKMEPHVIFTVAGGYPIKGHHILLNALAIVKKVYPDVKLCIPGVSDMMAKDFISRIKRSSYSKYNKRQVKKYQLRDNIVLMGRLTPEQMAEQLAKSHVFVTPSSCENHCSSLIEAMIVGTPTISSNVGGISQYYKDGVNGRFYSFDEPEELASLIIDYFKNKEVMIGIANKGKDDQRKLRAEIDIANDFEGIYSSVVANVNR